MECPRIHSTDVRVVGTSGHRGACQQEPATCSQVGTQRQVDGELHDPDGWVWVRGKGEIKKGEGWYQI